MEELQPWLRAGHFRPGDDVLLANGDAWWSATVDAQTRAFGVSITTSPEHFRHRSECPACSADVDRRDAAHHDDEATYRATFTPAARERAEKLLGDHGLVEVGAAHAGLPTRYRMSPHAPLPAWLRSAIDAAQPTPLDTGFPEFVRVDGPLDWPALVRDHRGELVPDDETADLNSGPGWSGVAEAFAVLAAHDLEPALDAMLSVTPDDRIVIYPIALRSDHGHIPEEVARAVSDTLMRAGRPERLLDEPDCADDSWALEG